MKTYILMKNRVNFKTVEDIAVSDIEGVYQNICKAFWECRVINLENFKKKKSLKEYIIKEIELETDEILTTYEILNKNTIVNLKTQKKHNIPVFEDYKNSKIYERLV